MCETVADVLRHNWMIANLPDGAPGIVNMSEIPQIGIVVICGHRMPYGFASGGAGWGGGWGYCGVSGGGRDDNMSRFSPGNFRTVTNFSLQFFPGDQDTVDKYN